MCIWDSYVYQKAVLCFLLHKSYVRSIKRHCFVRTYAAITVQYYYYYYYYYCHHFSVFCEKLLLEQWIPNLWIYDYKITFSAHLIAFLYLRSTRRFYECIPYAEDHEISRVFRKLKR